MTEAEWSVSQRPSQMLWFLRNNREATDRKLRLWACACVRRVWSLLPDDQGRQIVEVAERYADGQATIKELEAARLAALMTYNAAQRALEAAQEAVRAFSLPSDTSEKRSNSGQPRSMCRQGGNQGSPRGSPTGGYESGIGSPASCLLGEVSPGLLLRALASFSGGLGSDTQHRGEGAVRSST
jgi:hypothetical protein